MFKIIINPIWVLRKYRTTLLMCHCVFSLFLTLLIIRNTNAEIEGNLPCYIIDMKTSLPIPNARVCLYELDRCISSDEKGACIFTGLSPDMYTIKTFSEGYDTLLTPNIAIKSGNNILLIIELLDNSSIHQLDKIVVQENRLSQKKLEQTNSVARLNNFELANIAGTGNDINRVLHSLPSVVSFGADFDNTFYVRGGHSRENVYLIDGIEMDNISHFSDLSKSGGGIGYVNGVLLDHLDFYAGGVPSSYPPILSSVTDIYLRNGSLRDRYYQFDLNMAGLSFLTEGPFITNKSSYLFNIRYSDITFLKKFIELEGTPRYGDNHLKLTFNVNERTSLSFTGLFGFDIYTKDSRSWGFPTQRQEELFQSGMGVTWDLKTKRFRHCLQGSFSFRNEGSHNELQQFSGPIFFHSSSKDTVFTPPFPFIKKVGDTVWVAKLVYKNYRAFTKKEIHGSTNKRNQLLLKDKFSLYLRHEDQLEFGLSGRRETFALEDRLGEEEGRFSYLYADTAGNLPLDTFQSVKSIYLVDSIVVSEHAGGYMQYIFKQGIFKSIVGIRADYWRLLRDYGFSPRLGTSFEIQSLGILSLSGGLYYQLPAHLSDHLHDIMVPNPYEPWRAQPDFSDLELQRNWQVVFGFEHHFPKFHTLTIEGYYKWYDREYTLFDPDTYLWQHEYWNEWFKGTWKFPEPKGKKKAYGIELSFQKKNQQGVFYSLGYSLFSVQNKYADGKWHNDENNLRNTLGLSIGYTFLKQHTLSCRLAASEGRPYCKTINDSTGMLQYDTSVGYFTERIDPVLSLNLRYGFKVFKPWGNITGYIEVWNILNYKPVVQRYKAYNYIYERESNGIIPVAGFSIDF